MGSLQVAPFVGMVFVLTNYLQQMLGYSALSTGLAFDPMGVLFLVVSGLLSARFVNRFGVKPILISGMTPNNRLSRISLTEMERSKRHPNIFQFVTEDWQQYRLNFPMITAETESDF